MRLLAPSFTAYPRSWLRPDLVAGLTVWAVLVPESLAYATIAGVSPVVGLYAAVPALVLYAVVGSSRHLVVAPMSATAALSAGVVATVSGGAADAAALTAGLALATGLVAVAAGALRLGFLASFISEPVLKGFIIGLALTIMIGQLPALVGVDKGSGSFFEKLWDLLTHLGDAEALAVAVGLGSLAALLALRRFVPLLPGSLVVALASIGLVAVLGLDDDGLDIVGHIDSGLPVLGLPDLGRGEVADLLAGAVGVMLVGFAEGLGAAKTYAARSGYDIDPDRELLGLGAANLGAGLTSGMVVNGSLSKTAVNGSAGARSQVSGLTAAALTVVTLLFLTGLFEQLPEATLAAVVVAAVVELVDVASLRRLWRVQTGRLSRVYRVTSRADFFAAVAALLGVLVFDTLPGLVIGIAVSLTLLLARTSRPHVVPLAPVGAGPDRPWVDAARHRGYPTVPGVLVVRVEAPLLFANADYVRTRVRALAADVPGLRLVVLDGRSTPSVDVTAAQMLVQLRSDLRRDGAELALAEDIGQVRDVLATAEPEGEPPLHPTIEAAIAAPPFTRNG
ncbi:SulP family inorganic anion transporter [Nocardioides lianchengensis]|uniref:High affinity sulphate transporter 1 n=1 Tax=Nocardioides lianchengensis TaxID=1045774 RepID=A0A1G6W2P9_9ACTN|nr:SulP family inorganic anion transporter [Nocardioides lianchengensis]NYG09462.1 high affinity sulfate transporter 1 [Nocardioides lianchengensis]SDD60068.1 high affinity sulphate transporter 1 [Nocardioides lianchengensis]